MLIAVSHRLQSMDIDLQVCNFVSNSGVKMVHVSNCAASQVRKEH